MNVELVRTYEDRGWRDIRINIVLDGGAGYFVSVIYSRRDHTFGESSWFFSPAVMDELSDYRSVTYSDVPDDVKQAYAQHVAVAKVMARGDDP